MMNDARKEAPIRLLLVEDEAESALAIQRMLDRRGVGVCSVTDAESALDELAAECYDIVVSDVRLGAGMTGVDLLRSVRDRYQDLPVILITGFDSLNSAIEAVRLGAQDYILKPFDQIEELLIPVEKAVRTHRLEVQNRQLQRELKASESRFRDVLGNAVDVIFQVNVETGTFEYVSPSCREVLGMSQEDIRQIGIAGILHLVPDQDAQPLLRLDEKALRNSEIRFRDRSGGARWLSISASVVRDSASNQPVAVVGSARDVTEVRRMKEQEREYRQALVRAERMQSLAVLAGGVAHDLNNILMPILTLPGVILDDVTSADQAVPATLREDLAVIARSGERAAAVARDLLSLSRCQFLERTPMPINSVVDAVLTSGTVLELKRSQPKVAVTRELSAREPLVNGSETHLYQALLNLVINAFEAMPNGGHLQIATDTCRLDSALAGFERIEPGEYVRLTVTDTGHGIPHDAIDRVFEPFHSRKQRSKHSGTGLGLAVVYGVAKGHEGYVDLRSVVDEGTEFQLYLPLSHQSRVVTEEEEGAPVGGSEPVLLVDDEDIPREMAARMLRQLGYQVTTVRDGHEAVELIGNRQDATRPPYALVLLDMVMEDDFDGLDTYRVIARLCPDQRCMLISGYSDGDRVREAQRLGAGAFLQKPFSVNQLARKVRGEIDTAN